LAGTHICTAFGPPASHCPPAARHDPPLRPCDFAGCLAARGGPLGSPFLLHRLPVTTTGARAFLLLACATRMAASRPLITTDDLCRSKERKTDSVAPRTSRYGIELVAKSVNMTHTHRSLGRVPRQLLCRPAFVLPCLVDVIFGGV